MEIKKYHRYKEKKCKYHGCDIVHKKKGPYCSQACSNKDREVSENVRENMRRVAVEYQQSPEGIASSKLAHQGIQSEDFAISIPDIPEIPFGYDSAEDW